jgi:hypothetical protein
MREIPTSIREPPREGRKVFAIEPLIIYPEVLEQRRINGRAGIRFSIEQGVAKGSISSSSSDEREAEPTGEQPVGEEDEASAIMSSSMVASIRFYKFWISPLLPPACRFVPTCSIYGMQAIKEFGPYKGAILTAWRILRCSPFGGKGYDPPRWPPVFYTYSSY